VTSADGIVPLDPGPLLLARRAEALVVAGTSAFSADGALEIEFLTPFALAPEREGLTLMQGLSRLQRFFDAHVREYPTQWFSWGAARAPGAAGS